MGSASGIDLQSQVLIPGQAIVKSSEALGTETRIAESANPSMDAADFRQRMHAVFDALPACEEITGKEASQVNGEPGLVCDKTSGPASGIGLHGAQVRDAKGVRESASYITQETDLSRINLRRI